MRATTMAGLPEKVTIWEVGPRDGLQNETAMVPVAVKAEFVQRLVSAGLRTVETTSLVHPRWVPQLADAEELLGMLPRVDGVRYPVLVPNARGLARARVLGVTDIAVFLSATDTFARRNLSSDLEGQFALAEAVLGPALEAGMRVRGYVSMCFGDPWEGDVDPAQVVRVAARLLELGCDQVSLGDTIGVATPGQVRTVLRSCTDHGVGIDQLAVHFHDTYGQALSNTLIALLEGITVVDASAGGLGGCPFAKSATGNLATEDLVWQLHGLGIETGVDLDALVATSAWMAARLGRPSASPVVRALTTT